MKSSATWLKEGDRVKIRGTPKRGKIETIHTNINNINWTSNKPHFIEVSIDGEDGVNQLAHPTQLRRLGNK